MKTEKVEEKEEAGEEEEEGGGGGSGGGGGGEKYDVIVSHVVHFSFQEYCVCVCVCTVEYSAVVHRNFSRRRFLRWRFRFVDLCVHTTAH